MLNTKTTQTDINKRLDVFLSEKLDQSRSQIQKIIKAGAVFVNNKTANAHYKIQENDIIEVRSVETRHGASSQKITKLPKLDVISETNDYLVINKPAGVIVHGGPGVNEATLVDALEALKVFKDARGLVGDDPMRPGIVHRLDKEASGLMVIAKNNKIFEHLKNQFQNRQIIKKYFALAYGAIDKESDEINFPISRSAKGYKMAAHAKNQEGRRAITSFEIKQNFINYTLLDINIKTGRTHQIRVHMSAYGHPIIGDELYATKKTKEQNKKLNLNRIFLHAYYLSFSDLQNTSQEFTIELPKELKEFLKTIK